MKTRVSLGEWRGNFTFVIAHCFDLDGYPLVRTQQLNRLLVLRILYF
jgi:hypothetical protein